MFFRQNNGRAHSHAVENDALPASELGLKRRHASTGTCPPRRVRARNLGGSVPGSRKCADVRPAETQRPKVES